MSTRDWIILAAVAVAAWYFFLRDEATGLGSSALPYRPANPYGYGYGATPAYQPTLTAAPPTDAQQAAQVIGSIGQLAGGIGGLLGGLGAVGVGQNSQPSNDGYDPGYYDSGYYGG